MKVTIKLEVVKKGTKARIYPTVEVNKQSTEFATIRDAKLAWLNGYIKRGGSNRIFFTITEAQDFAGVEILNAKKL